VAHAVALFQVLLKFAIQGMFKVSFKPVSAYAASGEYDFDDILALLQLTTP
jgi:hypothetical protein